MSLISLLISLGLERARHHQSRWLWQQLTHSWFRMLGSRLSTYLLGGVMLPMVIVWSLSYFVQGQLFGLGSLAIWIAIPLLTLGCPKLQSYYRDYLNSAAHGDQQACQLFNERMGQLHPAVDMDAERAVIVTVRHLCWLNYRYYFAIIFCFSIGGPVLATGYGCLRSLHEWCYRDGSDAEVAKRLAQFMEWVDWIPCRVNTLSYALVGNFSAAFPVWLRSLRANQETNAYWIGEIAAIAQGAQRQGPQLCVETTTRTVTLLKSTILMAVTVISLLTIYGWLI
jgi:AmpE protein